MVLSQIYRIEVVNSEVKKSLNTPNGTLKFGWTTLSEVAYAVPSPSPCWSQAAKGKLEDG